MTSTAVETLSFDRHLRHAFASLSGRLENGIRSLDGVIEMLRLRIEAEAQFAAALEKIISNQRLISSLNVSESLRKDGLDAIHADMHNEYTQRIEFLNSLNEDVYQPCVSMRELYAQKNRSFAHTTKSNIKTLRSHQNQFYKIKSKYEKVCKDASNARTALLNAKLDAKISSAQILKLGAKVNSTLRTQQQWKEKYDEQQLKWNRQQIKFDDEMTSILQGMQSNEFNRMNTTKDCLNKWAVFITNLCANRNYDVKNLAESMSLINIDADLQIFIRNVLNQYPAKNAINGMTPPHHSFHYGKAQQNAASNLNKISTEKNIQPKVDTDHRGHAHQNSHSLSLSSFNPSFNTSQRKGSTSYSFSGQQDIFQELSKRPIRQSSSIGSFFKQKFKKDRSMNGHTATASSNTSVNVSVNVNPTMLRLSDLHREHSNTISSYHADSEVYPPIIDDEPLSPRTPKSMKSDCDPEIYDREHSRASSHKPVPRTRSMKQQRKKKKKRNILTKPRRRGNNKRHATYRQSQTPNAAHSQSKPVTPLSPHQILPPPLLSKSQSHPLIPAAEANQSPNTSSYGGNMHNHYHNHNHNPHHNRPHSPVEMTPTSPTQKAMMRQQSPHQTAITINHSTMSPNSKIKMNVQPQQIIVFKKKKPAAPSIPPQIAQSSNDIDEDNYDGLSTPELSGASDDDEHNNNNNNDNSNNNNNKSGESPNVRCEDQDTCHDNNNNNKRKTDTPLPVHVDRKQKKLKSNAYVHMEFAENKILNTAHFYAESGEDEPEPQPQPQQRDTDPLD